MVVTGPTYKTDLIQSRKPTRTMSQTPSSGNLIQLSHQIAKKMGVDEPAAKGQNPRGTRVLAITSGKGGVGKTNIVANLGIALQRLGKKVMVFDADVGLGNLDILLGLAPKFNFSDVILGNRTVGEILIRGPENLTILPAGSGIEEMTGLSRIQTAKILKELEGCLDGYDFLLCDTAAGISSNVMYFSAAAQDTLVVTNPEPTAITDAYALMKVLSQKYGVKRFGLIVNMVSDLPEAQEVFRQITLVTNRFLNIELDYIGHVPRDLNIRKSVRRQRAVSELYPDSRSSQCLRSIAVRICNCPRRHMPEGPRLFFWEKLLDGRRVHVRSEP